MSPHGESRPIPGKDETANEKTDRTPILTTASVIAPETAGGPQWTS